MLKETMGSDDPESLRLAYAAAVSEDPEAVAGQGPLRSFHGDPIDDAISRALDRLDARRVRVRDPKTGRWTIANGGRLETGEHSWPFFADLEPAREEIERRVCAQLGLDAKAPDSETQYGLIGAYAEARLIRRSEFLQLTRIEDDVTTAKQRRRLHDRRRRHLAAWALAFDRELKAALALGLERKTRRVTPMQAIAAEPEVRQ